jgi:hypothetical protein
LFSIRDEAPDSEKEKFVDQNVSSQKEKKRERERERKRERQDVSSLLGALTRRA